MKKTSFWIILIAVAAALAAAAAAFLFFHKTDAVIANVYVDGVCVRSVDLSAVTAPMTFDVEGPIGINTIEVEPGRIRVSHADCPDQICVDMGWLGEDGVMPIVCLPNKVVIQLETAPNAPRQIDGVTG